MARSTVPIRRLVLAGLVGLLVVGGTQVARAHRTALRVEIVDEQASVSPDGRSMTFNISTTCDRKWAVVDATATATQPQASGQGSFTPTCARIPYVVQVTVPATSGSFRTGPADVTVRLVVAQGPGKSAQDSASLRVRPSVSVLLSDRAVLRGDGSVLIDVTVTCPMSAVALGGEVRIYDGVVLGVGTYGPTPCDTAPHTLSVRVASSQGPFRAGAADAIAFTAVEEGGDQFPGSDLLTIQIVA